MDYNLPTRDKCQDIVKNTEAFYCTETEVQGYKVEMYDYRLAGITDFFPNIITFEENDEKISIPADYILNGKALGYYSDDELQALGFSFFRKLIS